MVDKGEGIGHRCLSSLERLAPEPIDASTIDQSAGSPMNS
jgi:hypothetical protein